MYVPQLPSRHQPMLELNALHTERFTHLACAILTEIYKDVGDFLDDNSYALLRHRLTSPVMPIVNVRNQEQENFLRAIKEQNLGNPAALLMNRAFHIAPLLSETYAIIGARYNNSGTDYRNEVARYLPEVGVLHHMCSDTATNRWQNPHEFTYRCRIQINRLRKAALHDAINYHLDHAHSKT